MKFAYKVLLPLAFTSVLCAIFYGTQHDKFPKDASPQEWGSFLRRVLADVQHTDPAKIMLMVLLAHFGHVILCVPCIHLTQMLCGYCLGFLFATLLCVACECVVVTLYVLLHGARHTFVEDNFEEFVTFLRRRGLLFPFIFLSLMSSMPINSTSCIIGFGEVTASEFIRTHYVVTLINSSKCCILGQQIRFAGSKTTIVVLGYLIFMISVIPTLITFILWYLTFVVYRKRNSTPSCPPSIDCENSHDDLDLDIETDGKVTFLARLQHFFTQCPLFVPDAYNAIQSPTAPNDTICNCVIVTSPRDIPSPVEEMKELLSQENLASTNDKLSSHESLETADPVLEHNIHSLDISVLDNLHHKNEETLSGSTIQPVVSCTNKTRNIGREVLE